MAVQYCPIMQKPIFQKPNTYLVNSDRFSPDDLDLFIESMDIIERYERKRCMERKLRNEKRRKQKLEDFDKTRVAAKKSTTAAVNNNHTLTLKTIDEIQPHGPKSLLIPQMVTERRQSSEETTDEPVTHLEAKKLLKSETDETYYSGQDSLESSPHNSLILHDIKLKPTSDSEESGVFPVGEPFKFDHKEQVVRPRSAVINKSPNISPRSQIIGLAVKRYCALSKSTSLNNLNLSDDVLIAVERCDRALAEIMNQNYDENTTDFQQQRQGFALMPGSLEEHFLDKALSLLQL